MHPFFFFLHCPPAFQEASHLPIIPSTPPSWSSSQAFTAAHKRLLSPPPSWVIPGALDNHLWHGEMEKPSAARTKHENKQAKKKQIKVVYISNPMRVKTTAAEFKGLVQELTGQDSDIAERLSKFGEMEQADVGTASADRGPVSSDDSLAGAACPPHSGNGGIQYQLQQQQRVPSADKGTPYDMLDENFPAQILDDLESFMPSSSYYDSSPAIDESKNLA